jgi:hypothetical protein
VNRFKLNRRSFLRGAGGVAIALPFLEVMADHESAHAQAGTAPLRYLVTFAGLALASDRTSTPYVLPQSFGANWADSLLRSPADAASPNVNGFAPLVERNLTSDVTLVSNLHLPRAMGPAHWNTRWHPPTMRPLLCGMSSADGLVAVDQPTSDAKAAALFGQTTRFKHLALRGQPQKYRFSDTEPAVATGAGRLSADDNGPIEPFVDPGQVFEQLFGLATGDATQAELSARKERAVVDLVLERANALRTRLGSADQQRLDKHLAELFELQKRLAGLGSGVLCMPGAKPNASFDTETTELSGWSNETLRNELMTELMYMAFKCDLTRAGSLMYTYASSYTAVSEILGREVTGDLHELTHSAGDAERGSDLAKAWYWHVDYFAKLVEKLKMAEDIDGSSILRNSMLVFMHEAGFGTEPGATDELNDNFGAHSGNNMFVVLAGGAGGTFTHRGHVDGQKQHPTRALVSAMHAVGVEGPLGEVTSGLDGFS